MAKRATEEDIKRISVEQPKNEADKTDKSVEDPSPLTGEVVAPAQSEQSEQKEELTGKPEVPPEQKKDTPVVNIEKQDGKIVPVDAPIKEYTDETVNVREDENVKADTPTPPVSPPALPVVDPKITAHINALEKENNDLHKKMRDADKRVGDLLKERDALKKEILESPAEKLRAELEVSRREYELLLGNQQKPNKTYFG